jgi:hypothetical protein
MVFKKGLVLGSLGICNSSKGRLHTASLISSRCSSVICAMLPMLDPALCSNCCFCAAAARSRSCRSRSCRSRSSRANSRRPWDWEDAPKPSAVERSGSLPVPWRAVEGYWREGKAGWACEADEAILGNAYRKFCSLFN